MHISKLELALQRLLADAAGSNTVLSAKEAKTLPQFAQDRIQELRDRGEKGITAARAYEHLAAPTDAAAPPHLPSLWDAWNAVRFEKSYYDLSKKEVAKIADSAAREFTRFLMDFAKTVEAAGAPVDGVAVADLDAAGPLLKDAIDHADVNLDGAVREPDLRRVREHAVEVGADPAFVGGLDGARRFASAHGGSTLAHMKDAVDRMVADARAGDKDANGVIDASEKARLPTVAAKRMLDFVVATRGKTLADLPFPEAHAIERPRFSWSGTPAEVCQSLLDAHGNRANDNFWPGWGNPTGYPQASRYVVDDAEAAEMVEALRPLYLDRQKAVLTELAGRTHASTFACVSPSDAGRAVFQAYAAELGLELDFQQPAAPSIDI